MATVGRFELVGREQELERVREWVGLLGAGPSALLVRGEPGIGKTSVWTAATTAAREAGALLLVSRPVEAELPLGYAGLGDLFGAVATTMVDELPGPLGRALAAALLLRNDSEAADPLAVGRGTLAALRLLAAHGPVVVAIDDVQWLDAASARALAFAARRLESAAVALAVSLRDGHEDALSISTTFGDAGVEIALGPLTVGALAHLIRTRVDPMTPRRTVLRLHERSGGNPFFALELARAGADGDLPSSLRQAVQQRLAGVPLVAAPAIELAAVVGPTAPGSFDDGRALEAALASGILVEREGEVRFGHPLLASGAYDRIPAARRRSMHLVAAERASGLERRARHLGIAADGPDERVAALLEEAARGACARGAPEAAAELAAYARRLTPTHDAQAGARRTMDEADYLLLAADEPAARALADEVLGSGIRGAERVRALMQRALFETDPQAAVGGLEEAVREPHDDLELAARARSMLAWQRGAWLGDVDSALVESRDAVAMAERIADDTTLVAALTTAGLVASLAGDAQAETHFRRALAITDRVPSAAGDHTPRLAFAHERWWRGDWATAEELLAAERRDAEQRGDDGLLMRLNVLSADFESRRGRWDEAARLLEAALVDARDYWRVIAQARRAVLRARRGDRGALADAEEVAASPLADADPVIAAAAQYAIGLLDFADGRYRDAAERLVSLPEVSDRSGSRAPEFAATIPEVVATLVEIGHVEHAEALTRQLERRAAQLHPWGAAAVDLCHGWLLLGAGETALALDRLAAARLGWEQIGAPWELGLTLFAEGNALRRSGRRRRAAGALERAAAIFAELGAAAWRQRATEELRRARPRPRRDDSLTAAEDRVAALVSTGYTNKEIATQLFTTVATVEAHLTRIYRKIGVRSRTELTRRIADGAVLIGDT